MYKSVLQLEQKIMYDPWNFGGAKSFIFRGLGGLCPPLPPCRTPTVSISLSLSLSDSVSLFFFRFLSFSITLSVSVSRFRSINYLDVAVHAEMRENRTPS